LTAKFTNQWLCSFLGSVINSNFNQNNMLITTTPSIEGHSITKYHGVITGEAIIGANLFKDIFASITDLVGGRSSAYEKVLREAKDSAMKELQYNAQALGANGVVGIDLDYETIGAKGSMLMVTASGTAITYE
jgi:uncharacterized protein YbjQ (UPF0145 family)